MKTSECEISVVIPTRNRALVLGRCLEALAQQTVSAERFEVIVSDDGSSDETPKVVERLAGDMRNRLLYLRQEHQGASAARNRAIERASGALLLMINDDTIPTGRLLEEHLGVHRLHPSEGTAVLGRVTIAPELPHSLFAELHLDATYRALAGREVLGWEHFLTCNLSISRSFLLKYGTFEETIPVQHEDIELGERLSRHGLTVRYCPQALAYHYHFIDEGSFLRSALQDGASLVRWYYKAPHLRQELASVGFYRTLPALAKVKYWLADGAFNPLMVPILLRAARRLSLRHPSIALEIYGKVYQSIKRRSIRRELSARKRLPGSSAI